MSKESIEWLNSNTLVGFTEQRGHAWHYREGSDNHFPGAVPVDTVLSRLFSWEAVPAQVLVSLPDVGYSAVIPDRQAIVRSDTLDVLGVFKDGYRPHQYGDWLVKNVATILADDLGIGSAGLLKGGAVAWVQVEIPESVETPEGVTFRPNLLACTSFDGSLATTYKRTQTIVVCDNTMAAGLSERGEVFRAKHSRNSGFKIAAARDALGIVQRMSDEFAAQVATLCSQKVSPAQFSSWLNIYVPLADDAKGRSVTMANTKREEITKLYRSDLRVAPWNGTAFGVLQAANTYTHHVGIVRGASRPERNMMNAVDGTTTEADARVLETLYAVLN